jgi:hypothetical protein
MCNDQQEQQETMNLIKSSKQIQVSGRPPSGRIKIQLDPHYAEFQSSQIKRERLLNVTNTKALPKTEPDH